MYKFIIDMINDNDSRETSPANKHFEHSLSVHLKPIFDDIIQ